MADDNLEKEIATEKSFWRRWSLLITKDYLSTIAIAFSGASLGAEIPRLIGEHAYDDFFHKVYAWIVHVFDWSAKGATSGPVQSSLDMKPTLVAGMFAAIGLLFVWSMWAISFSKSKEAVTFSRDALKTILGFFIGSITGFVGK